MISEQLHRDDRLASRLQADRATGNGLPPRQTIVEPTLSAPPISDAHLLKGVLNGRPLSSPGHLLAVPAGLAAGRAGLKSFMKLSRPEAAGAPTREHLLAPKPARSLLFGHRDRNNEFVQAAASRAELNLQVKHRPLAALLAVL